ncbi:hypothetical protein KBC03_08445 [Patescibacteria group bacterium]|nr:hypothetical protein [Patescibacteria group bacterium]
MEKNIQILTAIILIIAAFMVYRRCRRAYLIRKIYNGDITKAAEKYSSFYKKIRKLPIYNPLKEEQENVEAFIGDYGDLPEIPSSIIEAEITRLKNRSLKKRYQTAAAHDVSYVAAFLTPEKEKKFTMKQYWGYYEKKYMPFEDLILDGGMTEQLVAELSEKQIIFFGLVGIHSYLGRNLIILVPYERASDDTVASMPSDIALYDGVFA